MANEKPTRNVDAEYTELTYGGASSRPWCIPSRYRQQIKQWECHYCPFVIYPDRSKGNFGRVSHGRAEMRKHIKKCHSELEKASR